MEDLKQVLELLIYLKVAVEGIREQLSAKRKDHYTVEEFAGLVGRTPFTVRRWVAEGRINAIRISGTGPKGRLLIARDQLDRIIESGLGTSIPDAAAG